MPLPIGPPKILALAAAIFSFCGASATLAQSVGPDEGPGMTGGIAPTAPTLSLTPSQEGALYQAAQQQRGHSSAMRIDPTVGATVSRAAELSSLPGQAGIDDTMILKYAMVDGDVVVVDPVMMRVVDVIRGSMRP